MAEGANAADIIAEGGQQDASGAASQEPAVKHQLQNSWVLWFDNPVKRLGAKDWSQNLKKVATFDMVEDFWGIFNNIRPPSRLNAGSNYHLFKAGIEPMWEHEGNKNGGKWTYSIPKKDAKKTIDSMWLYTILAMIGENFEAGDELCGAVISLRKGGDRVAVWTKSAEDEKACLEIGGQFKAALTECLGSEIPADQIEYHVHNDALQASKKDIAPSGRVTKAAKYTL
mmetsp:Transcript_12654/g.30721  ORF Transcript_12654/g.30721 Transcript_12654/m.30721 type:complete len:227 (+) Transcript_12654:104-784(+)|eukprot:CAMPEP_0180163102 /NCGR_PEP_ID=MMETSP0986-20121125/29614_1 /TAXON_ID=697907 /ORGANISM="non described non described, Strain CCMP2293" /LENGTH=226 /DNA_ID=CAMNT_0022113703 /DNA_START=237 /DNA_END=917 /DNA_ORIENTATION=-